MVNKILIFLILTNNGKFSIPRDQKDAGSILNHPKITKCKLRMNV